MENSIQYALYWENIPYSALSCVVRVFAKTYVCNAWVCMYWSVCSTYVFTAYLSYIALELRVAVIRNTPAHLMRVWVNVCVCSKKILAFS